MENDFHADLIISQLIMTRLIGLKLKIKWFFFIVFNFSAIFEGRQKTENDQMKKQFKSYQM